MKKRIAALVALLLVTGCSNASAAYFFREHNVWHDGSKMYFCKKHNTWHKPDSKFFCREHNTWHNGFGCCHS